MEVPIIILFLLVCLGVWVVSSIIGFLLYKHTDMFEDSCRNVENVLMAIGWLCTIAYFGSKIS